MHYLKLGCTSRHIVATACLLTAIGGCGSKDAAPSPGGRGPSALTVEAVVVRPTPLEDKIITTGTLLPNEEVQLRPEISGRVTQVAFQEGSQVNKGQLLLKIDDRELQAQLKRKKLEENLASDEEKRHRALLDINGISREEYDRTANSMNMLKAERELIEAQVAKMAIIATFDGVIGLRYISEGGYVASGTIVASIQQIDPMKVEFSAPEKYAGRIKKGATVSVQVGDSPNIRSGEIFAIDRQINLDTRTIKARATIPNHQRDLIAGSFARITIVVERIDNALVVPSQALIPDMAGEKVFVCRNGKAVSVRVKTGLRMESTSQIVGGLSPNDTLVTTGLLQLSDGRPIQVAIRDSL
ncbi:MAG: efflux RND transporter periplasmic adaptor subunit [candidate division Zixibacteria bacterium]|nr:efflux RND transporter periplasmic adaptor subunit [candidate division Zixibacteria bacterium]